MSGELRSCNGVLNPRELSEDGVIIYQRKKRARTTIDQSATSQSDAANEHEGLARVHDNWRNTLKCMLHLLGVGEGDGIQNCILDALNCYPVGHTRNSEVPLSGARTEDRYKANSEIENPSQRKDVCSDSTSYGSIVKLDNGNDMNVNTLNCQKVLLDIFCSKNFAFLCNLASENFKETTVGKLLDFSLINTKMRNGHYEQLPVSFDEDIQQLWNKLRKIGEVILLLSSSLSKISRGSQGKQVSGELGEESVQQMLENGRAASMPTNSMKSTVVDPFPLWGCNLLSKPDQNQASHTSKLYKCTQCGIETVGDHKHLCIGCEAIYRFCCVEASSQEAFPQSWYRASFSTDTNEIPVTVSGDQVQCLHNKCGVCDMPEILKLEENLANKDKESDCHNLAENDQTESSPRCKVYTCKQCSTEAISEHSLICDGCEAMYHFTCVDPAATQQILPGNWFCASCRKSDTVSPDPVIVSEQNGPHQNCAMCDRLEFSENCIPNGSRESSASSIESDEPLETSGMATAQLCKLCRTCEDEDRRFLICGHIYCPYKYYHIRCLRDHQIGSQHQQNMPCWYCPSCLCRCCYLDKDDEKIVLCDGCDEAYHTYCMKPPRTSVPKGQWYCTQCNMARAKEGMRRYEQWVLQQHGKKDALQLVEINRPLDMLLNAVEKVSSEDKKQCEMLKRMHAGSMDMG